MGVGLANDMALLKSDRSFVANSLFSGWNIAASLSASFGFEFLDWMSTRNACARFAYKGG